MKAFVPYLWHFSFIGLHLLTTQSALSKFLIKNLTKHFFCVKLMKELNTTSEVVPPRTTSDLINSDTKLSK